MSETLGRQGKEDSSEEGVDHAPLLSRFAATMPGEHFGRRSLGAARLFSMPHQPL
ncbi:MAG: hypothetical protein M3N45_08445 [Actinomycetota bacterium]|nr:hypothetical protein [Actinomycetota bacterium]